MSTITTINAGDTITSSRTVINTNFSNLNTDKIETSVIDTDTTLAANSDAKIPSQKAVKAYADSILATNASTTVRGIVQEATQAQADAGTAAGGTGARLFVNPSTLNGVTASAPYMMSPQSPTYVKTFHTFKVPMLGTSASPVTGSWTASSADVEFFADAVTFAGTGADMAYIIGAFRKNGSTGYQFSESNVISFDCNAILATTTVDHAWGFLHDASGWSGTYNQTTRHAAMFTANNGNLYAHTCNGVTATTTQITGVTLTSIHNYRVVADLGADTVYFYVDGVLKQTISTTPPTVAAVVGVILARSATAASYFSNPYLSIEMNP